MNLKSEYYPYLIGLVIVILAVFFGFGKIPFDTFWMIVLALLGIEGATVYGSVRKQLREVAGPRK